VGAELQNCTHPDGTRGCLISARGLLAFEFRHTCCPLHPPNSFLFRHWWSHVWLAPTTAPVAHMQNRHLLFWYACTDACMSRSRIYNYVKNKVNGTSFCERKSKSKIYASVTKLIYIYIIFANKKKYIYNLCGRIHNHNLCAQFF
jgi:hypothetical protein